MAQRKQAPPAKVVTSPKPNPGYTDVGQGKYTGPIKESGPVPGKANK